MIIEYHRPKDLQTALALLSRQEITTLPLGGGTVLSQKSPQPFAVVDLQELGLDGIQLKGNQLEAGAAVTLQKLLDFPEIQPALRRAIQQEASYNLRQTATLAGTLVACAGFSPLAAVLLALDASLTLEPGAEQLDLGDLLYLRQSRLKGRLITQVHLPLNTRLAYQGVSRTPADIPLVCAAAARWRSGRTRIALGGYGEAPRLALDGPDAGGWEEAVSSAYQEAGDHRASAEYRREMAVLLAKRALDELDRDALHK